MKGEKLRAIQAELGLTQAELAVELGLTATFVGLMERDVKPIEPRTELAAQHLLCAQMRFYDSHDIEPLDGDVALEDAMLLWDRDDGVSPAAKIVSHPTGDDDQYSSSWGACNAGWDAADDAHRLTLLLAKFVEITVMDGITPKELHEAYSVIPEYRKAMHRSLFKQGIAV